MQTPLNINFHIWNGVENWKKDTIDDINTLIRCLICNVMTRNRFEIKSRDQVEDVTYQLHRSWGIPSVSYNFIPCLEVEQKKGTNVFHVKLGQWIMSGIEKLQFGHPHMLYVLNLGLKKCFVLKCCWYCQCFIGKL